MGCFWRFCTVLYLIYTKKDHLVFAKPEVIGACRSSFYRVGQTCSVNQKLIFQTVARLSPGNDPETYKALLTEMNEV
jgi:hypothetical protein